MKEVCVKTTRAEKLPVAILFKERGGVLGKQVKLDLIISQTAFKSEPHATVGKQGRSTIVGCVVCLAVETNGAS